jgi:choline dehydrogenase-like flavoprotein
MLETFDAIVVGSGFGGAITACRLAEKGVHVLVLERGRRWTSEYPRGPGDAWLYSDRHPEKHHGWLDLRIEDDGFPNLLMHSLRLCIADGGMGESGQSMLRQIEAHSRAGRGLRNIMVCWASASMPPTESCASSVHGLPRGRPCWICAGPQTNQRASSRRFSRCTGA